jgi:hypothetical protein
VKKDIYILFLFIRGSTSLHTKLIIETCYCDIAVIVESRGMLLTMIEPLECVVLVSEFSNLPARLRQPHPKLIDYYQIFHAPITAVISAQQSSVAQVSTNRLLSGQDLTLT